MKRGLVTMQDKMDNDAADALAVLGARINGRSQSAREAQRRIAASMQTHLMIGQKQMTPVATGNCQKLFFLN